MPKNKKPKIPLGKIVLKPFKLIVEGLKIFLVNKKTGQRVKEYWHEDIDEANKDFDEYNKQ
jgi:hypothetical protein